MNEKKLISFIKAKQSAALKLLVESCQLMEKLECEKEKPSIKRFQREIQNRKIPLWMQTKKWVKRS